FVALVLCFVVRVGCSVGCVFVFCFVYFVLLDFVFVGCGGWVYLLQFGFELLRWFFVFVFLSVGCVVACFLFIHSTLFYRLSFIVGVI
ncbi:hypothetical protein, partial [Acinetobacter baumannii]